MMRTMSRGEERRSKSGEIIGEMRAQEGNHQLCGWMPRCHANCMQRAYIPSLPFAAGERS
jgi:hypothetical protein